MTQALYKNEACCLLCWQVAGFWGIKKQKLFLKCPSDKGSFCEKLNGGLTDRVKNFKEAIDKFFLKCYDTDVIR